ncbi:MAG: undecaprenyl-diphosphatase UppP [bacterium]|jgi:undecaprenyl-diphosphatase|nr:undecaprenyl-diphosphatase UppP [bacterium]
MTLGQAFILGLVQGVTEFLPISSSGFLVLIPELFGWEAQSITFDAFVHIATLAAVVLALWPEVKQLTGAFIGNTKAKQAPAFRKLGRWILLATIPVMAAGFLMQKVWEVEIRSASVVAWSFIIWGAVLYIADKKAKKSKEEVQHIGWKRSLLIGGAQIIALIPGTSRSGITITAGLFAGLSRETAARFSFLLAIPTIAAAGFFKLGDVVGGNEVVELLPLTVGFFTAAVSAFIVVRVFLDFLKRFSYRELAIFRILLGFLILVVI